MMEKRIVFHGLVILTAVILLISSAVLTPSGGDSEIIEQVQPEQEPDVTITGVTFSDDKPEEDQDITISVSVKNNMSYKVEGLNIRLLQFEENITDRDISIGGGNETTYDFEWEAEGGNQAITAILTMELPNSNERRPLDDLTQEIWVEPEPMGDVYTPVMALAFIFVLVFGSVLIPSILFSIMNKSSLKDEER